MAVQCGPFYAILKTIIKPTALLFSKLDFKLLSQHRALNPAPNATVFRRHKGSNMVCMTQHEVSNGNPSLRSTAKHQGHVEFSTTQTVLFLTEPRVSPHITVDLT